MSAIKHMIGILIIVSGVLLLVERTAVGTYIDQLKNEAVTVQSSVSSLRSKIGQEAKKRYVEAQDAKIDRVWKAIPGYNGLEVDREKSYKIMKKNGAFSPKYLVYKQVSPKRHLDDLPPSPIYRGHPDKPMVSFGINVAWGEEYLPKMLAVLKKHRIHATFFFEGRWVKKHPELAKMIIKAGHEGGNHSYSHPDMGVLSARQTREEMIKTNDVLEATINVKPSLFAPPSGSFADQTVKEADKLGMRTILWTVDTIDWRKPAPDELINRVMSKIHPGAIILMHPTHSSSASLDMLIQEIKAKQLKIDTVSNLLSETRVHTEYSH
ncbi:polysaccharide deacetylase family protein [Bacillus xiapuensis]|uniref:polysaccharide deacetylase family protein n=1 Tax=Bacillus xiapuensis TaxID=2014075 RepID=UPI000C243F55|nr:polysaccharide deacetylase family protein [Bacillus xiapuensis]